MTATPHAHASKRTDDERPVCIGTAATVAELAPVIVAARQDLMAFGFHVVQEGSDHAVRFSEWYDNTTGQVVRLSAWTCSARACDA